MVTVLQEYPPCEVCGFVPRIEMVVLADLIDRLGEVDAQDQAHRRHVWHTTRAKLASTSVQELRRRYGVSRVRTQYGSWAVTAYGLECLCEDYAIEKSRLWESDWEAHMAEKTWVLMEDFSVAFRAAREAYPPGQTKTTAA